jgi:hypothetical protein
MRSLLDSPRSPLAISLVVVAAAACATQARSPFESPAATPSDAGSEVATYVGRTEPTFNNDAAAADVGNGCDDVPATAAGSGVTLAQAYVADYTAYELGAIPGVPGPLGGCVIRAQDPNTLLIAGESERETGAIYEIKVKRGKCKHIYAFDGRATKIADAPHVDANLVVTANDLMLYTRWPVVGFGQLLPGANAPSKQTDLAAIGMSGGGAGGLGFVPPGLASAGELRAVTWPQGDFYHLATVANGALLDVTAVLRTVTLEGGPGGFAYIPAGSPGFPNQSLVVAEWSQNRVATYEVDGSGDPIVATRAEFFTQFPRPWGAYFDPVTGDFLFLTWGQGSGGGSDDKLYVVQGFTPPPPPPTPK